MSLLIEPFLGKYPHDPRIFPTEVLYRLVFACFPLCFAFCLIMLPLCGANGYFPPTRDKHMQQSGRKMHVFDMLHVKRQ